jgi:tRNA (guanine-N7-)-methyltransferase
VPDLDFRFDEITEQYSERTLKRVRDFASTTNLDEPMALEIGSNRGRFLLGLADRNPELLHIGIELRRKYARSAEKRIKRNDVPNAHVLCADANLVVPIVANDGQIHEFYLVCPDPWWKSRHEKRRIIQPEFLDLMERKMAPGGRVYIRTDVGPLADWMRGHLDEHPAFVTLAPEDYPTQPFPRSTRERHIMRFGMPMHPLYYVRQA